MDSDLVWHPEQYLLGNYFQSEVNELFRKRFNIQPSGSILDVGSGDGQYISLLADRLKNGQILGIDSSEEMVTYAKEHWTRKNLSFAVHRIEEYQQSCVFDFILSFWCLHWTQIELSFPNIFNALKLEGRFYAVFSSFSDNSILQAWHELTINSRYMDLAQHNIKAFNLYTDYFYRVFAVLNKLPFKKLKLELETVKICLPSMEHFKGLLLTLPFMKKIPEENQDDLSNTLCDVFQKICQRKYDGELYYETRPIFLEAIK
ncbi:class I SAM-dependent methyltransferase [Legionella drancourtii]|uniref:class I SAM-dependent methyltransferase n=1 Tax=Legionella drancourtii TaxID=168933 RepID=UPI0001B01985|nr:class I SAM-dependent methyltransferase [Legionella drancourtii]